MLAVEIVMMLCNGVERLSFTEKEGAVFYPTRFLHQRTALWGFESRQVVC